jgi:hypothetical protein
MKWYKSIEFGIATPFLVMVAGIVFLFATGDADIVDKGEYWRAAIIAGSCFLVSWFHSYKVCNVPKGYAFFWVAVALAFCAVQIGSTGLSF